jgi:hypothetical protein
MRKKAYGTVKVRAISGTYVVFLAFDMKEADATGLMGFAIQRTRLKDGEARARAEELPEEQSNSVAAGRSTC